MRPFADDDQVADLRVVLDYAQNPRFATDATVRARDHHLSENGQGVRELTASLVWIGIRFGSDKNQPNGSPGLKETR
jgi:hypothetical protein